MKLSTSTAHICRRFGDEEAIQRLAAAGFDALDFTLCDDESPLWLDGYREYAEKLNTAAKKSGITFNQTHCPFVFKWDAEWQNRARWTNFDNFIFPRHIRALEVSAMLGADHAVVHPLHHMPYQGNEQYVHDLNMDFYRALLPYAKEFGVKIAVENMWQRDPKRRFISFDAASKAVELASWVDELADPYIVACLDLGHSAIVGEEPQDAIRILGKERLRAMHAHDVDYIADLHTLPFLGKLDWVEITKALRDIGYEGDFTFESDNFFRGYTNETVDMACRFMAETGHRLIKMIEG